MHLLSVDVFVAPHLIYSWGTEGPPTIAEEQVQDHLMKVNSHEYLRPGEMHLRVLRGLADVVAKPLSIIFGKLQWSGKVPSD